MHSLATLSKVLILTGQIENAELLEGVDAVCWDPGEPVVVEVELPQGALQAVEGHLGDGDHQVVAHLQAPHAWKGNALKLTTSNLFLK